MKDDYALLIQISAEELSRCKRWMDLDNLIRTKFLEAWNEIEPVMMKEAFGESPS